MNLFVCKAKIYSDIRTFGEGGKYCSFKGQVRKNFPPKDGKEPCDFFDMVCLNEARAKYIVDNLAKDSYVLITGEVQNTKYEKDGKTYYGVQVLINAIEKADFSTSGSSDKASAKTATKSESAPAEKDEDEFDDFGI